MRFIPAKILFFPVPCIRALYPIGWLLLLFLLFSCSSRSEESATSQEQPTGAGSAETSAAEAESSSPPVVSPETQDSLLQIKAQQLARQFLILDGHIDLPYRLQHQKADVSQRTAGGDFDYVRAKAGGLEAPFMSIYIPPVYEERGGGKALADRLIGMVEQLVLDHPDKFALATSTAQVRENFKMGLISLPLGMENGTPIAGKLENLDYFYKKGIRYITLAHSKRNHICDSSYDKDKRWGGLSPFGKEVVQHMNRLGIMVDVSHISDSAFYQVIRTTKTPVIASHSSCRHFTPGFERNMSDEMIRALARNGGVIQINFGSTFISAESLKKQNQAKAAAESWARSQGLETTDPAVNSYKEEHFRKADGYTTVQAVAQHIDHVAKLVGVEYVGMGSDFDGVGDTLPEGLKSVADYPNLIYELLKMGYSDEDIEKICSGNVLRVWQEVERTAAAAKS